MWANELSWPFALIGIPKLTQHLPVQIQNRDSMPKPRRMLVGQGSREFANVDDLVCSTSHVVTAGAIDVVPHGQELAFVAEDLDALVLAVGDIDAVLGIACDVVRNTKVTWRDAGLTPGEEQATIRGILMHPRVAVAI